MFASPICPGIALNEIDVLNILYYTCTTHETHLRKYRSEHSLANVSQFPEIKEEVCHWVLIAISKS